MSDDSYPYPPELRDFFERRVTMHREEMEDRGWDKDVESVTEMVDDIAEAFHLGCAYGMYKSADLGNRVATRECTELRFTTPDDLETALHDQYSAKWSLHELTPHDDGTATVSLSRSWSEMEEDGVRIFELEDFIEETAIPYSEGYAVDFGNRPDLFSKFVNAQYEASDEDVRDITPAWNDD